jgi:hypothetical protein
VKEVILNRDRLQEIGRSENIGNNVFLGPALYERLEYWCHVNCSWYYRVDKIRIGDDLALKFTFMDPAEAVLFKLIWG